MSVKTVTSTSLAATFLLCPSILLAGGLGVKEEQPFSLSLGTYLSNFSTDINLRGVKNYGSINLEDALDLDAKDDSFYTTLSWRFKPNHRVRLGYYDFSRTATRSSQDSFTIELPENTYTFDVGTRLKTQFDWQVTPLTYEYSFFRGDNTEIAAIVGLHRIKTGIAFEGEAGILNQGNVTKVKVSPAKEASGPLPVLGIRGEYALNPSWKLGGYSRYFGIDFEDISGNMLDTSVYLEWDFSKYVSATLAYNSYNTNITSTNAVRGIDYKFDLEHDYRGPQFFLSVNF